MGIYDSNLSCWERKRLGLPNDHAGKGVLGEVTSPMPAPVLEEEETEEKVEKPTAKSTSKKTPKKGK